MTQPQKQWQIAMDSKTDFRSVNSAGKKFVPVKPAGLMRPKGVVIPAPPKQK